MARPRSPRGINKVCAQCGLECKQSAGAEIIVCPLFRATGVDPAKLRKPLRRARKQRAVPGAVNRSGQPVSGA